MTKAKITGITTDTISVEFPDKSIALVPTSKGQSLQDITTTIFQFWDPSEKWGNASDLPIKIGDEVTPIVEDKVLDYQETRALLYPSLGDQFDAAYWARQGDDTQQKNIDAKIKLVKEKVEKGKTYKESEVKTLLD